MVFFLLFRFHCDTCTVMLLGFNKHQSAFLALELHINESVYLRFEARHFITFTAK